MRKLILFILPFLMTQLTYSQANYPPCVHLEKSHLVFPKDSTALVRFYESITKLIDGNKQQVNILHIGGSHVQAGILSHGIRMRLSDYIDSLTNHQIGVGDRGILFPYRALKSNAPKSYDIEVCGEWTGQRNIEKFPNHPFGLAGAYVATADSASSLQLILDSCWSFNQLRILGENLSDSIHPLLVMGQDTLQSETKDSLGWAFTSPQDINECTLIVEKTGCDTLFIRGIIPMSNHAGITYCESGINGASVPCWLRCELLESELKELTPDLVIFGIGINDANCYPDKFDVELFKENYRQLINRICKVNPQTSFLFLTNNDCFIGRTRRYNLNTPVVEDAFMQLAREYNGAVFDTYQVMGGYRSSNKWMANKLMRRDHIHFTEAGYQILADLISQAIIEDYQRYDATR